ncbi:MAG: hypothetical protein WHV28_03540 [Bacteroidota bacterium]
MKKKTNILRNISQISRNKWLLVLFLLGLYSLPLYSFQTNGGYAQSWLSRNVGGRGLAMGGAFTAIANDPFAIYYNPAGVGFFSPTPIVASSASNLGFDRTNVTLAYAQQVTDNVGIGFGINSQYAGSFTQRDIRGNPYKQLSSYQYNIGAYGAYSMEFASIGFGLKYLIDNLTGVPTEATGVALDVGAKFNVFDLFSFGLAVQNIGGTMLWNTQNHSTENIPYTIRAGIGIEFGFNEQVYTTRSTTDGEEETVYIPPTRYLIVSMDAVYNQYDLTPTFIVGTEMVLHELIGIRGGISVYGDKYGKPQFFPNTYWGTGISLRPKLDELFPNIPFKSHIDYTVGKEINAESGLFHNISLVFEF